MIFQAGGSEDGRDLAATTADAIFTGHENFDEALAFSRDIKARAVAAGRKPDEVLIFPGIRLIIADTDEEAQRLEAEQNDNVDLSKALVQLGRPFNYYDFSAHDLDAPFPDLGDRGQNGYRSAAERVKRIAREENLTLRQAALRFATHHSAFVGSPATIASELERWFVEGAVDGFNIGVGSPADLDVFIERVLPLLRARGLVRQEYAYETLRENLGLAIPDNRYAAPKPKTESLHQLFRDLHAFRVTTFEPAKLAVNVNQRKTLVDTADRAKFVKVGDEVVSFSLDEVDGETLKLDALLKSGPVVLTFFRFEDCPACNIALPYYQRNLFPGLSALGATLIAVSPQVPEKLVAIKRRHDLPFAVATDRDNALARKFGVLYSFDEASRASSLANGGKGIGDITGTGTWELPMPTAVVIDQNRVVRFADVHPDWLLRTEAGPILAAVAALKSETSTKTAASTRDVRIDAAPPSAE
ncbi:MAG: hypothetical protein RLZZ450_4063 [Pseudomonadota bacterium]